MFSKSFIDENRDINVGFDWWTDMYEYWLDKLGYPDAEISFSGFWSQGDGASFVSSNIEIGSWLRSRKLCNRYRSLYNYSKLRDCYFNIYRSSGHYFHPYSVNIELFVYDSYDIKVSSKVWSQLNELEKEIMDDVRSLCYDIYHDLEKEYDHLTSDEMVVEALLSLGIEEFTEERSDVFASEYTADVLRGATKENSIPSFIPDTKVPAEISKNI